ncbi:MAG: ABC transporter permease [Acidobacteriia bacterium]|nr:ABC transporter permease [Terriglobia bacterium]
MSPDVMFPNNRLALFSAGFVALLIVVAICAGWISPYDPAVQDLANRLNGPSTTHWLGSDELGRDVLSRVIYGTRISITVSVAVMLVSFLIGSYLGAIGGYFNGSLDLVLNIVLINSFMAFPGVLLAIAFIAFLGPGLSRLILALCLIGWIGFARLARAQFLKTKEMDFVTAARASGASSARVIFIHMVPNTIQPIVVQACLGMANTILAEATLSFLGLGVPPPTPSWGSMLNDGRIHLFDAPHLVLFPAVAVMLAVLAFNFLGDALRDFFDTKGSKL